MDHHAIAGVGAGALTAAVLHPLDLLKIRYHVRDGVHRPTFPSLPTAFRMVLRELGWRGLFHGTVPGCIGAGVSWGSYFFWYERIKAALHARNPPDSGQRLSAWQHLYAGWQASFITAFLNVPLFLVKTRMELHKPGLPAGPAVVAAAAPPADARYPWPPPPLTAGAGAGGSEPHPAAPAQPQQPRPSQPHPYATMRSAFRHIVATEGFAGLYRGLPPALMMTVHGGLQFAVYEELKAAFPVAAGWVSVARGLLELRARRLMQTLHSNPRTGLVGRHP